MQERDESRAANERSRAAWEANAPYWDERMGEGNDWVERLAWPALTSLLAVREGERILDVACGNGLTSRRLAALGAEVVAFDFSPAMIERARARALEGERIDYRVLDATDEAALLALGEGRFDGALSNMALMDMASIAPLFGALARLLRPGGRFAFTVMHPAFNGAGVTLLAVQPTDGTRDDRRYAVQVTRYLEVGETAGAALAGQPSAQPYFHRSLTALLAPAFEAGLVLDGLEERAFGPQDADERRGPNWANLSQIPPLLAVRLRRPG